MECWQFSHTYAQKKNKEEKERKTQKLNFPLTTCMVLLVTIFTVCSLNARSTKEGSNYLDNWIFWFIGTFC